MKTRLLSIITIVIIITSCGTQKQVVKEDAVKKSIIPPPAGVIVMDTTTKVFASIKLPKNDNWVIKNKDATWRHDEFLVKKMDDWKQISVIRTMSLGKFSEDFKDTVSVVTALKANAGMLLCYNDYHFRKDGDGNEIETPVFTTKLTTLNNGTNVVLIEAEVKITNKESKVFGNSYYARNYYILAKTEDGKNNIPIISSATLLTPDNYEVEKQKFIELVDYVANTAVLNPEYKF